ncbi:NUDIX domain-containing protein [Litoreibacter roseus]|uniref:ADP-ribose pyrophosphatase n=1 Tax=Litoreibacter roseus TaxID=2601869 RepID=A0A6N6JL35_9RHOB|nr:NUDIX domain-containing protein [Litoreibacter roseus]GFE66657.1 tellurite resistance protein [Litoreibacter roseus]
MTNLFLYGTLCDATLLKTVLGASPSYEPAHLPDHQTYWVAGQHFPMIVPREGAQADGMFLRGVSDAQLDRISFYEGPFAFDLQNCTVISDGRKYDARVYRATSDAWHPGEIWNLVDWQDRFGPVRREAAVEIMSYYGALNANEVASRMTVIETRAQARVNAVSKPSPIDLRSGLARDDVEIVDQRRIYSEFFALDELDVKYRHFDGGQSDLVERAVFIAADAVTVLPYDPVRDRVLLIEQFRASLVSRNDPVPWLLEAIAGRIDPYETPEAAARREAQEEAGIELGALHHMSSYYVSPGAATEYIVSYLGIADLPNDAAGFGGLETEAEDIRAMVVSYDQFMGALTSGEISNAPLVISALWLAQNRARLRAGTAG